MKKTKWHKWENILRKGVNYLGLQIGWFACAIGAARGMPWLGPLVVLVYLILHLAWSEKRARELTFILLVGLLGWVVDSLKKVTGLISYASDISITWMAPPWIEAMWLLFSTSLNGTLMWLQGRYFVAVILGAVFGPLSYVTGVRLGAIEFNKDLLFTIVVLAVVWGISVPFIAWLAKKITGNRELKRDRKTFVYPSDSA